MGLFEAGMVGQQLGGVFAFGVCAALAMSAGIGGGGLFVPLLMILLSKDAKEATAMSQCLIAGAAIAGMAYNFKQRHPSRDRPLINVGAVVFLAPLQMGGALIGNLMNQILPKFIIIILMVVVLSFSAFKTLRKGLQLWYEEARQARGNNVDESGDIELSDPRRKAQEEEGTFGDLFRKTCTHAAQGARDLAENPLQNYDSWTLFAVLFKMKLAIKRRKKYTMTYEPLSPSSPNKTELQGDGGDGIISLPISPVINNATETNTNAAGNQPADATNNVVVTTANDSYVKETFLTASDFVEMEKGHNLKHWSLLGGVWLTTVLLVLARGGKGAGSMIGIKFCGGGYWALSGVALIVLLLLSIYVMLGNVQETEQKQACKYEFATGDIVWTRSTAYKLMLGTIFAGIVAGLIGIGGGMVIGPFLLDIGVIPQVSSAITATNVLLSSTTLAILVMTSGVVQIDESLFYFACCLVGAYLGKFYLGKLLRAFGRTSLIILILGGIITMCILVVLTMGVISWVTTDALQESFTGVCS